MGVSSKTIDVLEEIAALPIDTVIPGHGPVVSKDQTAKITSYLRDLSTAIHSAINEGKNLEELVTDSRFECFYETKPDYWSTIIQRNIISYLKRFRNISIN